MLMDNVNNLVREELVRCFPLRGEAEWNMCIRSKRAYA